MSRHQHNPERLRAVAGLVISVVALVGVAWWASKQEAPRFPDGPGKLGLVGVALGTYALATLARGWRWDTILRHGGVDHDSRDAYGLTVVGYMGNTVLPARGGELLRIVLLGERTSARKREILGAVLPERLLDAAALGAVFCVLTFAGVGGAPAGVAPAIGAAIALVAGVALLVGYLRLRVAGRFEAFAGRIRPVARASRLLVTPWGVGLFVTSVAIWCSEAFIFYPVSQSLDVSVSLLEALLVVVLGSFLALVPAGPGYVGTYDAAMLFGLAALDIRGGTALSIVLLFRFVVFVPITLVGLGLLITRYGGLSTLRRRAPATEPAG